MASKQCHYCRASYQAPLGQSTCPACQRVNIYSGLLDGVSPAMKVSLFALCAFAAFAVLVAVGMAITIHRGG